MSTRDRANKTPRLSLDYLLTELEKNRDAIRFLESQLAERVSEECTSQFDRRFQRLRRTVLTFVAGTGAVVLLDFGIGHELSQWLHDRVKSSSIIYEEIEVEKLPSVTLEKLPTIREELPAVVWGALQSGDEQKFASLAANPWFVEGLKSAVHRDLIRMFGSNPGVDGPAVPAELVQSHGSDPSEAVLTILANDLEGKATICGRTVIQSEPQVIVALPREVEEGRFGWLGCTARYPGQTWLLVTANGRKVNVLLQGVETGSRSEVELRLTQKAAMELDLPGALNFKVHAYGKFSVGEAVN